MGSPLRRTLGKGSPLTKHPEEAREEPASFRMATELLNQSRQYLPRRPIQADIREIAGVGPHEVNLDNRGPAPLSAQFLGHGNQTSRRMHDGAGADREKNIALRRCNQGFLPYSFGKRFVKPDNIGPQHRAASRALG